MLQLVLPYKKRVVTISINPSEDVQVVKPLFVVSNNERYCLKNLRAWFEDHFQFGFIPKDKSINFLKERLILLSFLQDLIAINDKSIDVLNSLLWHQRNTSSLIMLIDSKPENSKVYLNEFVQMLSLVGVGNGNVPIENKDSKQLRNVFKESELLYQPHTYVPVVPRCKFL